MLGRFRDSLARALDERRRTPPPATVLPVLGTFALLGVLLFTFLLFGVDRQFQEEGALTIASSRTVWGGTVSRVCAGRYGQSAYSSREVVAAVEMAVLMYHPPSQSETSFPPAYQRWGSETSTGSLPPAHCAASHACPVRARTRLIYLRESLLA